MLPQGLCEFLGALVNVMHKQSTALRPNNTDIKCNPRQLMLLVIRSPKVAAHFTREMDRLWRTADLGITERLRRKLERNRQRCGSGVKRV